MILKPYPVKHINKRPILHPEPKPNVQTMAIGAGDVLDYFLGYSSTRWNSYIKSHGEDKLTSLKVCKTPLGKGLNLMMDVISLGKYSEVKNKVGIDQFFHVFLVVNNKDVLEKNETANVRSYSKASNEECMEIPLGSKNITINDFILNASKGNEKNFFSNYNAMSSNCQWWVQTLLRKNNLLTSAISHFAFQSLDTMVKEMPEYAKHTVVSLTDTANVVNRLLQWISGGKLGFAIGTSSVTTKSTFVSMKTRRHGANIRGIIIPNKRIR